MAPVGSDLTSGNSLFRRWGSSAIARAVREIRASNGHAGELVFRARIVSLLRRRAASGHVDAEGRSWGSTSAIIAVLIKGSEPLAL